MADETVKTDAVGRASAEIRITEELQTIELTLKASGVVPLVITFRGTGHLNLYELTVA